MRRLLYGVAGFYLGANAHELGVLAIRFWLSRSATRAPRDLPPRIVWSDGDPSCPEPARGAWRVRDEHEVGF